VLFHCFRRMPGPRLGRRAQLKQLHRRARRPPPTLCWLCLDLHLSLRPNRTRSPRSKFFMIRCTVILFNFMGMKLNLNGLQIICNLTKLNKYFVGILYSLIALSMKNTKSKCLMNKTGLTVHVFSPFGWSIHNDSNIRRLVGCSGWWEGAACLSNVQMIDKLVLVNVNV